MSIDSFVDILFIVGIVGVFIQNCFLTSKISILQEDVVKMFTHQNEFNEEIDRAVAVVEDKLAI